MFLPTRIKTSLIRFPAQPKEDGGPAAIFRIIASGHLPSEQVTSKMAEELYRAAVRWGRVHRAGWEVQPTEDTPMLPTEFDEIVESAMCMDVS